MESMWSPPNITYFGNYFKDSVDSRWISTNIIYFDDYSMDSRWTLWIPSGVQMELDRYLCFLAGMPPESTGIGINYLI